MESATTKYQASDINNAEHVFVDRWMAAMPPLSNISLVFPIQM